MNQYIIHNVLKYHSIYKEFYIKLTNPVSYPALRTRRVFSFPLLFEILRNPAEEIVRLFHGKKVGRLNAKHD